MFLKCLIIGPPAVASSIAAEDTVENRSLYRVFVSRMFLKGSHTLQHHNRAVELEEVV